MARFDNTHSRIVAWLKVILPLAALAILSSLFLISRRIDPEAAIPYADVDVAERLREPRMTAPTYSGQTSDGAAIVVSAREARPDQGEGAAAAGLQAELTTPDGASTRFEAASARVTQDSTVLALEGGVRIASSSGYELTTDSLTGALDRTRFESAGAVQGSGPIGTLTAGRMVLTQEPGRPQSYVLVFTGGVKLIYLPPSP